MLDDEGNALGVMSSNEAMRIASSRGMDLVEISSASKPPVCKIVDYGKFNYERQKKEKLAKKNQHVMNIKEIRFNPNTDTHDIDFKTKHLRQFLMEGHKVKAYVTFKGRMITHPEIGRKLMDEIVEKLNDIGKLEASPRMEGKQLYAFFLPDKLKIQAIKDADAKEKKLEKKLAKTESKKEEDKETKNIESENIESENIESEDKETKNIESEDNSTDNSESILEVNNNKDGKEDA